MDEDEPQPMMGGNMQMMMGIMHGPDDETPDTFQFPQMRQSVYEEEIPAFSSSFCRRARMALHHLANHPLFLASVVLMFVTSLSLLVFACVRLSSYRARRAAFQRKYRVSFYVFLIVLLLTFALSGYVFCPCSGFRRFTRQLL